jgi:hypothetical protein
MFLRSRRGFPWIFATAGEPLEHTDGEEWVTSPDLIDLEIAWLR